jgi:hypothetical protein
MARMRILPAGHVPRMLRSAPFFRRGALLIRGPSPCVGPGSAAHRQEALHRVRDTSATRAGVHHTIIAAKSFKARKEFLFETASRPLP